MARANVEQQVVRSHQVRDRVVTLKGHSSRSPTDRSLDYLLATVESTERLGILAADALFPTEQALIPIEEVNPTIADFARSMILFAGAGIDATLKQLVRDCLRHAIDTHDGAQRLFEKYVERNLDRDGSVFTARILCASSPRKLLLEQYASDLTRGSFQSSQQIAKAAASLGVDHPARRKSTFDTLFRERNHVAHELDLQDPAIHGTTRRERSVEEAWIMADEAYAATLELIELVASRFAQPARGASEA